MPHRAAFNALTIDPPPARGAASTSVETPSPFSGFFFFIVLSLELSDTKVYEPSLELLRITAEQLFSNRELYRLVQLSVEEFS